MHLLTFKDETRASCQDVAAMRQVFVSGSGTKVVGRTTKSPFAIVCCKNSQILVVRTNWIKLTVGRAPFEAAEMPHSELYS